MTVFTKGESKLPMGDAWAPLSVNNMDEPESMISFEMIGAWLKMLACVVVSTMVLVITGSLPGDVMDGEMGSANVGRLWKTK